MLAIHKRDLPPGRNLRGRQRAGSVEVGPLFHPHAQAVHQLAAQPEEIAPAYVFLASDADSSYVTGIVLQEMGGETTGG